MGCGRKLGPRRSGKVGEGKIAWYPIYPSHSRDRAPLMRFFESR